MQVFAVYGQDNDSYAFREYPPLTNSHRIHQKLIPDMSGTCHPGVRRCEFCSELAAKWDEPLPGLVVKNRRYDISITYDGVELVSQLCKSACEASGLSGLVIRPLPDDPDFFAIRASRAIPFDSERRGTRFIKPCPASGRHESVVGATPAFLKTGTAVGGQEFVRTDLEFGSYDGKHPLLICGEVAANALCPRKLKGQGLIPVEASRSSRL
jgi:hypothetical protein